MRTDGEIGEGRCGSRHLRLAGWILGITLTAAGAAAAGVASYHAGALSNIEARTRTLETSRAADQAEMRARLAGIEDGMKRIERALERRENER